METTPNPLSDRLSIETDDNEVVYLEFSDIIRFQSEGRDTLIHVKNGITPVRSTFSISMFEEMLPHAFFFKCHRCHIIGLRHLKKFVKDKRIIQLADNHSAPIAEARIGDFLKYGASPIKKK